MRYFYIVIDMISFTNFKQWLYLLLDGCTSAFLLSDFNSLLCSTNYRYTGIQLTKSTQTLVKITLLVIFIYSLEQGFPHTPSSSVDCSEGSSIQSWKRAHSQTSLPVSGILPLISLKLHGSLINTAAKWTKTPWKCLESSTSYFC